MSKEEAFTIVYNELIKIPMFRGIYDAKNGSIDFMNGVACVMEEIAYSISNDIGEGYAIVSTHNMVQSEKKAGVYND